MKHELAEVIGCFIIGALTGKKSLRRIQRWCCQHISELREYMALPSGIPSVPTFSRVLAGVDEEMLSLIFTAWMEEMMDLEGAHVAIDGKGLRAAASKVKEERTPYILNAVETNTKLVIGQMSIPDKKNEMSAIPEFLEILEIEESTVTIDAIGTTGNIINAIRANGAHFMLQVKRNNSGLYDEILDLFRELKKEKEKNPDQFAKRYGQNYSTWSGSEKNRERNEYRQADACSDPDAVKAFQNLRPSINSIGQMRQVRIKKIKSNDGQDITPGLEEFLKRGSRKQPKPEESDEADSPIQVIGLISDLVMDAEQMAKLKREHWCIENQLHYILDEDLGEDKSTIRKGKANAALLRKIVYNIVRMRMEEKRKAEEKGPETGSFIFTVDDIAADWKVIAKYIFKPVALP